MYRSVKAIVLGLAAIGPWPCGAQDGVIAPGAKLEKLAGDFEFTEGPTGDAQGNVFFTDQPNDRILKWSVDGKLSTFLQPCRPRPTACASTRRGNLWACADEKNELWSHRPGRQGHACWSKDYQGKLLNGPNDVWVRPDGALYFTDPFYKRRLVDDGPMPQDGRARLLPVRRTGKTLVRVTDDLKQPNGIIGTPDGKTLYVADIGAGKTYSYDIQPDGTLADKTLFARAGLGRHDDRRRGQRLPDRQGRDACSTRPAGKIEHIDVPDERWTANVSFGGKDRQTLFITASKGLYAIRMRVKGANAAK